MQRPVCQQKVGGEAIKKEEESHLQMSQHIGIGYHLQVKWVVEKGEATGVLVGL